MAAASLVGVDTAGGLITGNLGPSVFINNQPVVLVGAAVTGHGDPPHTAPTMAAGSPSVFINNIAVVRAGDAATCGHVATGSSNVNIN